MKFLEFPDKCEITVTCASGIEKVLKSELARVGYNDVPAINGALTFSGDLNAVAKCNLNLRTADRVYIKIASFQAEDFDCLYEGCKGVRWEDYLPIDAKILVNGKSVKSKLFALSACQSIVKKAIVDRLGEKYKINRLAENGLDYAIEFSIYKDQVTLLLNTSGAGLHKRGYRDLVGIAPIKETLASGLLLLSDFYYKNPFADPFCGSGTIAVEAGLIALNIAPGIFRSFAFNGWKNFDKRIFDLAVEEARDKEQRDRSVSIYGSDIDPKAIKLAKRHAERAGLKEKIIFDVCDVKNFDISEKCGTMVTNPPYGERVYDKEEAEQCYRNLGKVYKNLEDWSLFVITSAKNFERQFGKRADRESRYYYYYANKTGDKK